MFSDFLCRIIIRRFYCFSLNFLIISSLYNFYLVKNRKKSKMLFRPCHILLKSENGISLKTQKNRNLPSKKLKYVFWVLKNSKITAIFSQKNSNTFLSIPKNSKWNTYIVHHKTCHWNMIKKRVFLCIF